MKIRNYKGWVFNLTEKENIFKAKKNNSVIIGKFEDIIKYIDEEGK
jgi:hypothetical protein